MRRDVVYAAAAVVGIGVLVLAGLGVTSLVDDDRSLTLDETVELVDARSPRVGAAAEITKWWAVAHRRRGEAIPGRGCGVASRTPPHRYRCEVSYRDRANRYRGFELTLAESQSREELKITRVRPRRAGPVGAPQQPR